MFLGDIAKVFCIMVLFCKEETKYVLFRIYPVVINDISNDLYKMSLIQLLSLYYND